MAIGSDAVGMGTRDGAVEGSAGDESRKSALRRWLLGALIAGAIAWEYAPALSGSFVYEDFRMTEACPITITGDPSESIWRRAEHRLMGRLLTQGSWCWQAGQSATAFHVVNLALHGVVTLLVGLLVWTLSRDATVSLLAATFFGVNAVNVEAVAYLSSRGELIAAIGVLSACLAALRGRWLLIAPLLLLGIGGKETAIVGLLLVPLCLWWAHDGRWGLITALLTVLVLIECAALTMNWSTVSLGRWGLWQGSALARGLTLAGLPFGQTVDYDYARVPLVLQVFAIGMLLAGLIWAWRHVSRLAWLGTTWIGLAVAPRFVVVTPTSVLSEHQLYLPLVGLALVVAAVLTHKGVYGFRPLDPLC